MPVINQPAQANQVNNQFNPQINDDPVGKRDIGSGFTNIKNILNANQDAGNQIGNTLSNNISNQAGKLQNSVDTNQAEFNNQATQANQTAQNSIDAANNFVIPSTTSTPTDYSTNNQQLNNIASGTFPSTFNTTQSSTPADNSTPASSTSTTPVKDDSYYKNIGTALNAAKYNGPTGLTNSATLQNQGQNLNNIGQMLNTSGGQGNLIKSYVATPGNYTQGQQSLDTLFLGQDANAQQNLKNTQKQTYNVAQNVQNNNTLDAATAQNYANTIANNVTNTKQNLLGTKTGLVNAAAAQGTAFNTETGNIKTYLTDLNSLTPDQIKSNIASGKYGDVNTFTNDLNNLQQYGINQGDTYFKNDSQFNQGNLQKLISTWASTYNPNLGGSYYQGNQQQANTNIANILNGTGQLSQADVDAIKNNNFNTNVFGGSNNAAAQTNLNNANNILSQEESTDKTAQQNIQNFNAAVNPLTSADLDSWRRGRIIDANAPTAAADAVANGPQIAAIQQYMALNNGAPNEQYKEYFKPYQSWDGKTYNPYDYLAGTGAGGLTKNYTHDPLWYEANRGKNTVFQNNVVGSDNNFSNILKALSGIPNAQLDTNGPRNPLTQIG